jgi:hypothetical protein
MRFAGVLQERQRSGRTYVRTHICPRGSSGPGMSQCLAVDAVRLSALQLLRWEFESQARSVVAAQPELTFAERRPVTPEVAGSSPVAPVENILQIGIFCLPILAQATAGFQPVTRSSRTQMMDVVGRVKPWKSPCSVDPRPPEFSVVPRRSRKRMVQLDGKGLVDEAAESRWLRPELAQLMLSATDAGPRPCGRRAR